MRLLLIEDDKELVKGLKKQLETAGYAVDVVSDGVQAQELGNSIAYGMVILDIGLPGCNGLEILHHWRSCGNKTPVLILTARDAWYEKVEGFNAGADDYLAKPFHIEELVVRVKALIHRAHLQPSGSLKVGSLELDEERQRVTLIAGESIELTGIEFKLLRYFMLNPGRILSKSKLVDHIYDFETDKESNIVEVYVNHLRNKLGKHRFETRRGQGYVFKELDQ